MNILVTGGAGYIGSHTLIELIKSGHTPVVIDNLSNSSQESLRRVEKITSQKIPFHQLNLQDEASLASIFKLQKFDAVIHFAGLKSVGESVSKPLEYYQNNLDSTLVLLKQTQKFGVQKFIFSSSATVYGTPESLPLTETSRTGLGVTNPYGQTKFMLEQVLRDVSASQPDLEITALRYFNPIGAHESGLIGEDPQGIPNNLLPYVSQVAVGKRNFVNVFGGDYDTTDGTGVRDYIHVLDLAEGHVAALEHSQPGFEVYNLGTGHGTSVLELIEAFHQASGKDIPFKIVDRRPGDIDSCYASPEKANRKLHWTAKRTIDDACKDTWNWQSNNPNGYRL